jgi:translation elongation factor EF-Tu-like GTPase
MFRMTIEAFRKRLTEANPGDNIGVLFSSVVRSQLNRGDVLTAPFLV